MTIYKKLSTTFLLLSIGFAHGCRKRAPEEVEEIIAKSETLSQIDQVCKEFPRPEMFELEKKGFGGNARTSAIDYQYIAHMPFEPVKAFYQDPSLRRTYDFQSESYMEPWLNEINFRRGEVSINVENRPPSRVVIIGCGSTSRLPVSQRYREACFAPINDPNKPDWATLPQDGNVVEVILSKCNELGFFAAKPPDVGAASEINSTSNGEAKLHRK